MIAPTLIAASAFALQAAAFLVPPEVAEAATAPSKSYHLTSFKDPKSDVYSLPCTNCPLAAGSADDLTWTDGVENALVSPPPRVVSNPPLTSSQSLNFTVDDATNTLLLNDHAFFPVNFPTPLNLFAPQKSDDDDAHPELRLGFAIETYPTVQSSDDDATLIPIHFTILHLADKPVNIDTVTIDLIKLPSGEFFIGKIDLIAAPVEAPGEDCTNQLCRLRAIILSRIQAMIAAAKARAHKAHNMIKGGCHKMRPHHKGPNRAHKGEHRQHGVHHMGHHRHHRTGLMRFINRSMKLFIIPALLGIVGGLVASIIGMMVGQFLVFLWFRFVRRNQRGPHARIVLVEEAAADEKEGLIDGEAPPNYEELHAAVDVEDQKE